MDTASISAEAAKTGMDFVLSQFSGLVASTFVMILVLCAVGIIWNMLRSFFSGAGVGQHSSDVDMNQNNSEMDVNIDQLYTPDGRVRLVDRPQVLAGYQDPSWDGDPIDVSPRKGGGWNVLDGVHRTAKAYRQGRTFVRAKRFR